MNTCDFDFNRLPLQLIITSTPDYFTEQIQRTQARYESKVQSLLNGRNTPIKRQPGWCPSQVRFDRCESSDDACDVFCTSFVDNVEIKRQPGRPVSSCGCATYNDEVDVVVYE